MEGGQAQQKKGGGGDGVLSIFHLSEKTNRNFEMRACFPRTQLTPMFPTDLANRGEDANIPVHIINVEIKDNHEDALVGGRAILQLAQM
ncbi:hypothetical protein BC936DRAFT_141807, partial [Jimgerdemannia flammicorona]